MFLVSSIFLFSIFIKDNSSNPDWGAKTQVVLKVPPGFTLPLDITIEVHDYDSKSADDLVGGWYILLL